MGILAALVIPFLRAGVRNAAVGGAASEVQMRLEQLQFTALAEQRDHVLVIVDVPNNDPSSCGRFLTSACVRLFDLRAPAETWTLAGFDPDSPSDDVDSVVDEVRFGRGIKFYLRATAATLPIPFDGLSATFKTFDPALTATCTGARRCVGYRFLPNGQVAVELPDPTTPPPVRKSGHAIALGTDLSQVTRGAEQHGVLVAVPSGIVRSFAVPQL
jgi:hypothetical protein